MLGISSQETKGILDGLVAVSPKFKGKVDSGDKSATSL